MLNVFVISSTATKVLNTHLKNIHVPKHIEEIEAQIDSIKEQKNIAVKSQQYEKAANNPLIKTALELFKDSRIFVV